MSNSKNKQALEGARDVYFSPVGVELRAAAGGGGGQVVFGYGAVFGEWSVAMRTKSGATFKERIMPGAFAECDMRDMDCRIDHDALLVSARNLRYGVDERGLWYEYDHDPEDPDHMRAYRRIQRRDITGSSFKFDSPAQEDQTVEKGADGIYYRTIHRLRKNWDVGPVSGPAYPQTSVFARSLDAMIQEETATSVENDLPIPTEAQKEAGNYKKAQFQIHGLTVAIEHPSGTARHEGWETLQDHYGYIARSEGADGEQVDVFVKAGTAAGCNCPIYVVDQVRESGQFDEHKVIFGCRDIREAEYIYKRNYPLGWHGLGAITGVSEHDFHLWLKDADKEVPFSIVMQGREEARTRATRQRLAEIEIAQMAAL